MGVYIMVKNNPGSYTLNRREIKIWVVCHDMDGRPRVPFDDQSCNWTVLNTFPRNAYMLSTISALA